MSRKFLLFAGAVFYLILVNTGCKEENKKKDQPTDLAVLNDRLRENPGDAELYFQRAKIFTGKNNLKQAYDDMVQAVSIDSLRFDYYMFLADISFRGLLIQKAIPAFEKAISLAPENPEGHLKMAELMLYLKAYPRTLSEASEVLRIDKANSKAYFLKGFAYKEIGDTAKAISSYLTAVETNPEYYDAYIQLGNLEQFRNPKYAVQYYSNAIRIQPTSTEALYNRGLTWQNTGNLENAIADYKTILSINNSYPDAHFNLGYIDLVFRKDYSSAIKHFTDATIANPEYAEAFYNRGMAYKLLGNKKQAEEDFHKTLAIIPTYKLAKAQLQELKAL